MKLYPYTDTWDATDPHANFKADVAHHTTLDPLPTVYGLSQHTGIPVSSLIRYILAKYAISNADALLATMPLELQPKYATSNADALLATMPLEPQQV